MRIINRVLGFLIALGLGLVAVLVIIEVVAHLIGATTPVLVNYPAALDWAASTPWGDNIIATIGIIAAVVGLIWFVLEVRPERAAVVDTVSPVPDVRTVFTRSGLENAVAATVGALDGVQGVNVSSRKRTVQVDATAAGREQPAAKELHPAVAQAAQRRIDELQLTPSPRLKARVHSARK